MINEGFTSLHYSSTGIFFNKDVCRTCALIKSHKRAHNKCDTKCTVKGGRCYADLTEIFDELYYNNFIQHFIPIFYSEERSF